MKIIKISSSISLSLSAGDHFLSSVFCSSFSPITSAPLFVDVNQASSPNFPTLYLERRSFGNPQTTLMKCGFALCKAAGSKKVENLFFIKRDKARIVIIEDCIAIITAHTLRRRVPCFSPFECSNRFVLHAKYFLLIFIFPSQHIFSRFLLFNCVFR